MGVTTRLAARKARKNGTKVLYMVHGFHFYQGAPKPYWMMFYPIEKFAGHFCDRVVTVNREDYERAGKMRLPDVKYIHGIGINTDRLTSRENQKDIRAELELTKDTFLVLSIGELNQNKNQKTIICAIAQMDDSDIHYILCGKGDQMDNLQRQAEELKVDDRVHFLGYRTDVVDICNQCDVYVMPSHREGLPVALLEAMYCGLPLVTSNIRGLVDVMENGVTGYLCETDDVEGFAKGIAKLKGEPAAFDEEILSLGGRIYRCPHYNGKNHFAYKKWWKDFWREHYSEYRAVHGHLGSTAAIYLKIAKKYGVYTIAHSHSTSGKGIKDILYQMYAYPTRFIADYFLGCSMDAGTSRYGKEITSKLEKFHVLNNAIDTEKFQYDSNIRKMIREKHNIDEKIVIGHVGRFSPQKNHDSLIDIFKEIYRKNKNTVLLLIGEGQLHDKIEQKVKRLGLQDVVMFLGVKEEVAAYYQAMDLFVFPSLYEGLGIVAVEAQTSGLQCIISNMVSKECIVTENQVTVCGLNKSAETWAEMILEKIPYIRMDSSEQVKAHGYDIRETSKWLTHFYLKETYR